MDPSRCPYCGSADVHRSRRRGFVEGVILRLFLLRPYRCHDCDRRHYRFIFRNGQERKPEEPTKTD